MYAGFDLGEYRGSSPRSRPEFVTGVIDFWRRVGVGGVVNGRGRGRRAVGCIARGGSVMALGVSGFVFAGRLWAWPVSPGLLCGSPYSRLGGCRCGWVWCWWRWWWCRVFYRRVTSRFGSAPAQAQTAGLCDSGSVTQFTDVEAGEYAAEYILCMRALELSQGSGGGAYGATRDLTRGQMASFLVRLWKDVLGTHAPKAEHRSVTLTGLPIRRTSSVSTTWVSPKVSPPPPTDPPNPSRASQISRFLLRHVPENR